MAIEGEEDVSDDQESETEDCDTEEDEGNIVWKQFMNWSVDKQHLFYLSVFRQDQVEGWAEVLRPDDDDPSYGPRIHHLPRPPHGAGCVEVNKF